MSSNFEFIDIKRIEPETKSIKVRKIEFGEIYQTQNLESVQEQSSRCLDCGNPYCSGNAPS